MVIVMHGNCNIVHTTCVWFTTQYYSEYITVLFGFSSMSMNHTSSEVPQCLLYMLLSSCQCFCVVDGILIIPLMRNELACSFESANTSGSCLSATASHQCSVLQHCSLYTCNITMATHLVHHPGIVLYMMWMLT